MITIECREELSSDDNNVRSTGLIIEECTMELRASIGDHIRIVFHPIGDDQDDYQMFTPKMPCFKIHDVNPLLVLMFEIIFSILESSNNNIRLSND